MKYKSIFAALAVTTPLTAHLSYADEPSKPLTESDGFVINDFVAKPELRLFYGHDSNVFAQHDDEQSDTVYGIAGDLGIESDWQQHAVSLSAGFENGVFKKYSSENYTDYWVGTEGRYDLSDTANVFAGINFSQEHEDRGNPDEIFGKDPVSYNSVQLHAGAANKWDSLALRIGATLEKLNFDNVDATGGGTINQDDRDRDLVGFGARLTYDGGQKIHPFVQAVYDKREYDSQLDDNGYARDSDGYRMSIGVEGALAERVRGEGYVGVLYQYYDDSRFDDVTAFDFGGNVKWYMTPQTNLTATLKRSLEETTLSGTPGYLMTRLGFGVDHRFNTKNSLSAFVGVAKDDYQEIDREDTIFDTGISYRHFFTPNIYFDASYSISGRDSSVSRLGDEYGNATNSANIQNYENYFDRQIFFTVGALLYPTHYEKMPAGFSTLTIAKSDFDWSGFYAGALYGRQNLLSKVDGVTDIAEYGDNGSDNSLFIGYGWRIDDVYLGLEAEYEKSLTKVEHQKTKAESQTIELSENNSFGAGVKLGYETLGGSLIYGRLGIVKAEFDTFNKVNNQPIGYDDQDSKTGKRYGLGVDIPATDQLFVRMDYSLTDYNSYTVDYLDNTGAPDSADFDNNSAKFSVGLGWYFDKQSRVVKPIKADHDGVYAGLLVGHGALASQASGVHNDNSTTSDFFGDFANETGLKLSGLLGYGVTYDRLFLGLEAEIESGKSAWDHVRTPDGRDFALDKKGSYGLGLRAGYTLDSGALLYARYGVVKSKLNTEWTKGGNSNNYVDRDDNIKGKRFGLGAEVPLSNQAAMRFEYTYTDYDAYNFVTSHAEVDSMKFENSEALFKTGLIITF